MTCDETWELMTAKPDPTTCTNAEVAAVIKHLRGCAECKIRYSKAKAAHDAAHGRPRYDPRSAAKLAACMRDPEALGTE